LTARPPHFNFPQQQTHTLTSCPLLFLFFLSTSSTSARRRILTIECQPQSNLSKQQSLKTQQKERVVSEISHPTNFPYPTFQQQTKQTQRQVRPMAMALPSSFFPLSPTLTIREIGV
jgi:hypothetical protein